MTDHSDASIEEQARQLSTFEMLDDRADLDNIEISTLLQHNFQAPWSALDRAYIVYPPVPLVACSSHVSISSVSISAPISHGNEEL